MIQMTKKKDKPKARIAITIDENIVSQLDKVCEKENRNRSNMIESILKGFLSKKK